MWSAFEAKDAELYGDVRATGIAVTSDQQLSVGLQHAVRDGIDAITRRIDRFAPVAMGRVE